MNRALPKNVVFGAVVFFLGIFRAFSYDINEHQILEELLSPRENPSIQVKALRRELLKKVQEALDRLDAEENYQEGVSSLVRWNNFLDKKSLESLARSGYIKTLPETEEDADANYKRSIANLAKNGQLPRRTEEQKRGIESLARNGELRLTNLQRPLEKLSDKRHLGSIMNNYDVPLMMGKKSLSSLAKSGDLNNYKHMQYKRSPVPGKTTEVPDNPGLNTFSKQSAGNLIDKHKLLFDDKRQIGSLTKRGKRDADYYYENENFSPVYQNVYDYDDLIQDLHDAYLDVGKRFLGSVVRSGWSRPSSSSDLQYIIPEKRHIGSLARLGWLPSFRQIRRFNRSDRSMSTNDSCRVSTTDGKTKINGNSEDSSLLLKSNDKYSYIMPDKTAYLKRIFHHPIPNLRRFY